MIRGYRRRRGWLAWHVAVLTRFDYPQGFPELDDMMGMQPAASVPDEVALAHNLRLWRAALTPRTARRA